MKITHKNAESGIIVQWMKTAAVLIGDVRSRGGGAFALFPSAQGGAFGSQSVPTPGNLPSKRKKMLMPGG